MSLRYYAVAQRLERKKERKKESVRERERERERESERERKTNVALPVHVVACVRYIMEGSVFILCHLLTPLQTLNKKMEEKRKFLLSL